MPWVCHLWWFCWLMRDEFVCQSQCSFCYGKFVVCIDWNELMKIHVHCAENCSIPHVSTPDCLEEREMANVMKWRSRSWINLKRISVELHLSTASSKCNGSSSMIVEASIFVESKWIYIWIYHEGTYSTSFHKIIIVLDNLARTKKFLDDAVNDK